MKIAVISICGEDDHPLINEFVKHCKKISDKLFVASGLVDEWHKVNGDTIDAHWVLMFSEKTEQQNHALRLVDESDIEFDYLFYFDIDEFLPIDSLEGIIKFLKTNWPDVVNFQMNHFWKSGDYIGTGGDGWAYNAWCPRIFKYKHGMRFSTHRPPTIEGYTKILNYTDTKINHYSYVFSTQVERKLKYYDRIYPNNNYLDWFRNVWQVWTPENRTEIETQFSVHPSCKNAKTQKYEGMHDIEIEKYLS